MTTQFKKFLLFLTSLGLGIGTYFFLFFIVSHLFKWGMFYEIFLFFPLLVISIACTFVYYRTLKKVNYLEIQQISATSTSTLTSSTHKILYVFFALLVIYFLFYFFIKAPVDIFFDFVQYLYISMNITRNSLKRRR